MTGHAAQVHVLFLFILFIWFFNQCFSISQEVFLFLFFLFFSFPFFFFFFFMRFRLKDLTMWLKECWKHCLAVCWISFPLVSHMEQLPLDFSYMIFLLIRTKIETQNTKGLIVWKLSSTCRQQKVSESILDAEMLHYTYIAVLLLNHDHFWLWTHFYCCKGIFWVYFCTRQDLFKYFRSNSCTFALFCYLKNLKYSIMTSPLLSWKELQPPL